MAFKSVKSYNDERFGGMFLLRNDGDYADVVFLYPSVDDVLVADTHYIKSPEYSGYVHCCGKGCPACAKNIRVQTKLFIPLYNIDAREIQFWDRGIRFETQLQNDVFSKYPDPSNYVFRITRHGVANSVDTSYEITAVGRNTFAPYAQILADHHTSMPEHYENVCKEIQPSKLNDMLNASAKSTPNEPYQVTPRSGSFSTGDIPTVAPSTVVTNYTAPAEPSFSSEEILDDDLAEPEF